MAKATSNVTEFISGKLYWAKVFGDARPNYGGDANEWTFELEPDENGVAILDKHGLTDRLKDKDPSRGKYITLKKPELKKNGEKNQHIRVYNKDNEEWPEDTLIGNGSSADVKLNIADYGAGRFKGIYPNAIRVTDLVKYASSEFGAMDGEQASPSPKKEAANKTKKKDMIDEDFGSDIAQDLDDDVPF